MNYFLGILFCVLSRFTYAAPVSETTGVSYHAFIKMFGGLTFILIAIVALGWLVKRLQVSKFGVSKGLQVQDTLYLGPKEKIVLLKAGNRYLLIGIGSSSITCLHDFGEEKPVGFDVEHKMGFSELLKNTIGKSS